MSAACRARTTLIEANRAREAGGATDEAGFQETLRAAVAECRARQKELGIDVPGDGEFGKSMGHRVNYGAWWSYAFQRLGGLDLGGPGPHGRTPRRSRPGEIVLTKPSRPARPTALCRGLCAIPNPVSRWGRGRRRVRSASGR